MEGLDVLQQAVFEHLIQPLMLLAGLDGQLEDGYVGALWVIAGAGQLLVLWLVIVPLQRWRPAEEFSAQARRSIRVDILYTHLHRLGLFRALMFVCVTPLWSSAAGYARSWGLPSWQLDALWPGVTDSAWVSFLLYLVVFDFVAWGVHFLQHRWGWWWQLHALHHSQRHMTAWTDTRNHVLDDILHDMVFVFVGLMIGVAPAQFVALLVVTQLLEHLSHANVRLSFGRWGSRLLVSPAFHRVHHAIEPPSVTTGDRKTAVHGCNYGVLFPWWDQIFGTADFSAEPRRTGLLDQLPEYGARDYGDGFWAQQRQGVLRLMGRA